MSMFRPKSIANITRNSLSIKYGTNKAGAKHKKVEQIVKTNKGDDDVRDEVDLPHKGRKKTFAEQMKEDRNNTRNTSIGA